MKIYPKNKRLVDLLVKEAYSGFIRIDKLKFFEGEKV